MAVAAPSREEALQREIVQLKQEAAQWKQKFFSEIAEQKQERTFRKLKGLKATPKNVALILRRKWRFPGTKENPQSKENLDAAGRRLINVQGIADELDISDKSVRSGIDLLQAIGLLFDVEKHGHLSSKYDRLFFRWNEELYQHPERIDKSKLPKKAGGNQFLCPSCLDEGKEIPMETRNAKYGRCPCCNHESLIKDGEWKKPRKPKPESRNQNGFVPEARKSENKTSDNVSTHTPLESPNQNGSDAIPDPPEFLRRKRIWCCGRLVWNEEDKRFDKVPYIADMRGTAGAKSNDPKTWRTYGEAKAVLEKSQSWTGTYAPPFDFLMFMCDGTFTFLDQDHCRNPETGEIDPAALERARKVNSYTEDSWSRDGIHTYAIATLPPGRRRIAGIEMYDQARPCVYTGRPVPGFPLTIEPRQDEIAALHAEVFPPQPEMTWQIPDDDGGHPRTDDELEQLRQDVLAKVGRSKSASYRERFMKLWNGDISDYQLDHSRADAALCRMLAYWVGKCVSTVDWLFRRSKLCRAKWIERADYRERTFRYAFGEAVAA